MNGIRIGAIVAFLGVALGAFGAHALRGRLDPALSQTFETGVRYQMFHALALIALGLLRARAPLEARRTLDVAAILFLAGVVLFAGSLYLLAATGTREWGIITPFGGLAFLVGWILFAIGARREA